MRVRDIWTEKPRRCTPDSNLAEVASIFWEANCGSLPVVDDNGQVVGMITDRDVCMATGTRNQPAADIAVRQVISGTVWTCLPDDDLRTALRTMQSHKVRRLPVVDIEGHLQGVLSLTDVALASRESRPGKSNGMSWNEILPALDHICRGNASEPAVPAKSNSDSLVTANRG